MSTRTNQELKSAREDFIGALYDTVRESVSPTPVMEIQDNEGDVEIDYLDGRGTLPSENSVEIDVLDLNIASTFFDDFHLLWEGETGGGKSHAAGKMSEALFGDEGFYEVRMSSDPAGPSPLDPFLEDFSEGSFQRGIDPERTQKYGGIFMDEINRGKDDDIEDLFQVLDGKIHRGDESQELGLPIPGEDRLKRPVIISAMNPNDAEHVSTSALDIAGENRFLKFEYPNGTEEAGSTQMDKNVDRDLHSEFWNEFRRRTGIEEEWEEIYPQIADSELTDFEYDERSRELIDVSLAYIGKDLQETFSRNEELIERSGYDPKFSLRDGHELEAIQEQKQNLKHGFVRRDIDKIENMGKLLSLVRQIKQDEELSHVTMEDTAAAMGIALESKTTTDAEYGSMMSLVNDTKSAYDGVRDGIDIPEGLSVRGSFLSSAIQSGIDNGFEGYVEDLEQHIEALNDYNNNNAEALVRSRLMADMSVLENFSQNYRDEIEAALDQDMEDYESMREADLAAWEEFQDTYQDHKSEAAVYDHRLGWIGG